MGRHGHNRVALCDAAPKRRRDTRERPWKIQGVPDAALGRTYLAHFNDAWSRAHVAVVYGARAGFAEIRRCMDV